MKRVFPKQKNNQWSKENGGTVDSNAVKNGENVFITDIQSGGGVFFEKKEIRQSGKGLSDSLFKPFFFKSESDSSIFDPGLRPKEKEPANNFKIKGFNYFGEDNLQDSQDNGVINLKRKQQKYRSGKPEGPILSSFSAGVRNVFRNARYGNFSKNEVKNIWENRSGNKLENKPENRPKNKPQNNSGAGENLYLEDKAKISFVSKLERENLAEEKKQSVLGDKKNQNIQSAKVQPKISLYEEYEKKIKLLRKADFLSEEQREKINRRKEKLRLEKKRKMEMAVRKEQEERRRKELALQKKRAAIERKKEAIKKKKELELQKRRALIFREQAREAEEKQFEKEKVFSSVPEESVRVRVRVVNNSFGQAAITEGRKANQPTANFERQPGFDNLPKAGAIKPSLDPAEVSRKEILSFFESCKRYFEKEVSGRNNLIEDQPAESLLPKPVSAAASTDSSLAYNQGSPISNALPRPEKRELLDKLKEKAVLKISALGEIIQEAFSPRLRKALVYSSVAALTLLILPVTIIALKGIREKSSIEEFGTAGYGNLKEAQASIEQADIKRAGKNFELAYGNFLEARKKLEEVGGIPAKILKFVPGISKIESGKKMAQTGESVSLAGGELAQAMSLIVDRREDLKNNLLVGFEENDPETNMSLTDMVVLLSDKLKNAKKHLEEASEASQGIDLDDFSGDEREKIMVLQKSLPEITGGLDEFSKYTNVFLEILGQNGGRKYLLLFQNNHEARATGGFIGTYGIIKVNQGVLENIKVEGIYDPDGQLKEKIIPPEPIQKMSAAWSMHDSNWWPDFPTSAEKISWFYEKTGGPTVDGVISFTPKVIQELLEVTGPIRVDGYGPAGSMLIDQDNFMEEVQYQVEVDYDKEENKPKKILADMTPLVINKIFSAPPEDWPAILGIFSQALQEKSLLLYSFDCEIQKLVSEMGWSGEVLDTTKDYLSVINSNISGLKTDGVIKQNIIHQAEIQDDGSIIDTVTVKRKHEGGNEAYDWYNATNCDWIRVYVPQGSELISASGFTREFVDQPLDYEKLGFKDDFQVKQMEESFRIDENSATRIYDEEEKTVFANWVYVSPGETATVSFKYLLPFRIDLDSLRKPADAYSLLVQKQAGSENVELESGLTGLDGYEYIYVHPSDLAINQEGWNISEQLATDKFFALVLKKK